MLFVTLGIPDKIRIIARKNLDKQPAGQLISIWSPLGLPTKQQQGAILQLTNKSEVKQVPGKVKQ